MRELEWKWLNSLVLKSSKSQVNWNRRHGVGSTGSVLSPGGIAKADFLQLIRAQGEGRLVLIKGTEECQIAQGLWTMCGGSHTPGFQWVRVEGRKNDTIGIASDAAYLYDNIVNRIGIGLCSDSSRSLATIEHMCSTCDVVIPGHDLTLCDNYSETLPGVFTISNNRMFATISTLDPQVDTHAIDQHLKENM